MAAIEAEVLPSSAQTSDLKGKKVAVTTKLQQREENRLSELETKRSEKEKTTAVDESVLLFNENFKAESEQINKDLLQAHTIQKSSLADFFDKLTDRIQTLQKYVNESTRFIPSYDLQQSQKAIANFLDEVKTKRGDLIPKKKFAFKSKKTVQAEKKADEKVSVTKIAIQKTQENECGFSDERNAKLMKVGDDVHNKDIALARLDGCVVILYGAPSAVHIDKLTNCTILIGPVSGSVFIDNCSNCKFALGCQQLRIHNTSSTQFYIHVTSKAIIEDCNNVEFGNYNWSYPDLDSHFVISGLNVSHNNWSDVDDFNWLASDKHSPNWSLIDEANKVKDWEAYVKGKLPDNI